LPLVVRQPFLGEAEVAAELGYFSLVIAQHDPHG
jgi:hypothetical protein